MILLAALLIVVTVAIYAPVIRASLVENIDATHPDCFTSGDLRERGWSEWDAHEAVMRARAERLGYTR